MISDEILTGDETILLVDDEEVVIEAGEQMLSILGYNVVVARGGAEAIDIFKKNHKIIDMVLLDMVMPEMGGGEAYDRMKSINADIKVLLSSGYSINGQASDILNRGCDSFIQKPFNLIQLSQKVREVLSSPN
jgi:CheY-like chemotaxis protein